MSLPSRFQDVLRATGFLIEGQPAPGMTLNDTDVSPEAKLRPDAVWSDRSNIQVLFKFVSMPAQPQQIASWHRDAWNLGAAPLLWIVSPQKIELYNAFQRPDPSGSTSSHLLQTFTTLDQELARLDDYAGRLAMISGRFWTNEERVNRQGRVDQQLLRDLQSVEKLLCEDDLDRNIAQGLLGRTIFLRYLTDRGIVTPEMLKEFGSHELDAILSDRDSAYRLFDWIRSTFNGDLFPITGAERRAVRIKHLRLISQTLAGVNPSTKQGSLWPYKFDVIPIELISSIYEQFAHKEDADEAATEGLHYTPVSVVNLVLDEVLRDIKPGARILDMTCGSGVFLVEALRRLVRLKAGDSEVTRQLIRKTIKDQIFGVDKNEAAIRIASFSLYLAALELDPNPRPPMALRFEPLIGKNLFIADAFKTKEHPEAGNLYKMRFDAIVGNPPWTYSGQESKPSWPPGENPPLPPRSQDFAFVWKSLELANEFTRFGFVMRATPFFSTAEASRRARNALFRELAPIAIVNLSALREELFPTAEYPAVVLFARLHNQPNNSTVPVISVPWTSSFSRSGAFEVSPTDVHLTTLPEIEKSPYALKALALGTPRDRLLLRRLNFSNLALCELLKELDLKPVTGVQLLEGDRKDATHLLGLPLLDSGQLRPNIDSKNLGRFNLQNIHRPRDRTAFRGPLVIVGEGLRNGRISVGNSKADVVYTRSFYGISFADQQRDSQQLALCLTGILQSAVASWYLLLTASEFGIHKRKVLLQDIEAVPVPALSQLTSSAATAVASAVQNLDDTSRSAFDLTLKKLDAAVFDLYQLEKHDRLVVNEGLARAKREYVTPRLESDLPIRVKQLDEYSKAFLEVLNSWSGALGREKYSAEVLNVRNEAALRIVRFVGHGNGKVVIVALDESLNEAVSKIGKRMSLPIAERLAAVRELRVHAENELFVIKPAARRFWSAASGLNDADAALGDGLEPVRP